MERRQGVKRLSVMASGGPTRAAAAGGRTNPTSGGSSLPPAILRGPSGRSNASPAGKARALVRTWVSKDERARDG
ncbi:hypothetical protein E4U61_002083 [Claviceps capensis]|nr:hypothetical protein E4U61_002083 [Claviceps capensis]